MFLRNERSLQVKNGTLGTVEEVSTSAMRVRTDDGRSVAFDLKDYAHVDHGYAATIHKAQGMTVDNVHVLATPGLDRHASYVALSRHRDSVDLHYGKDDFADRDRLVRVASRERGKDMVSDYAPAPEAARRVEPRRGKFDGLRLPSGPVVDSAAPRMPDRPAAASQQQRVRFDGLRLKVSPLVKQPGPSPLDKAVTRYGQAAQDIIRMKEMGYEPLIHQRKAFGEAIKQLDALHPGGAEDMRHAMNRNPALISEAAKGRTRRAIQAMAVEREIRIDARNRADRFVADWQSKSRQLKALEWRGDYDRVGSLKEDMGNMAKALHRDPQLESLLRNRTAELGIRSQQGSSISHDLQQWLRRSRGLGISM